MAKYMQRIKSLFEILPDNVEPRLPDIEERPIDMKKAKESYPKV